MKRKTWKYFLFICFIGFIYYFLLSLPSTKSLNNAYQKQSFRAAIVTLTRGDPIRLLNMLHSIEYFFPQSIDKYPVIIFYDSHDNEIQSSTIDYIKSCVKLRLIFENIVLFTLMRNPIQTINIIKREIPTIYQRSIGYRFMCQFWSHTVFHHPLIKNNYDYIMRLDDDSYFLEPFDYDLFEYAYKNKLDYIYRALAWDIPMSGPDYLLPRYLRTYHNNCKSYCFPFQSYDSIYNNFFLTRVQFWYQKPIEQFLNNLLLNDSILINSLGDGNIHAVILALASDTNRTHRIHFAYAHNIHIYRKLNKNFDVQHNYQNWFQILKNNSKNACQQLVIIEPYTKQLKYIHIRQEDEMDKF
ncbi:unnamed protein product [Rotaria sordida]|uniref:Hexosyltransferase n=1 Tax=Rotaria sordida TaxID=392033 RepID=A0A814QMI8_9BILA|nr:unnamed protein product [Rotaria sordida]CAF3529202.1 unnamed protein product [Rotaria sordida]